MSKHIHSALLASAMPIAPERKDTDPAAVSLEVKNALNTFLGTFEDFKKKNDERLSQVEKKGGADTVTKEEVERINKALSDAEVALKKRVDEQEARLNRMNLSGAGGQADEVKAAADFSRVTGRATTPDELREYKTGLDAHLRNPERKATTLSVGSDPAGGFLVTPDTTGRMVKKIYESSPMRQLATVVTIGTDVLEGPIDNGEADAEWVGEAQTRSQTSAPMFGMWKIPVNELYAYPKVTQKILDDASIDVEAWLAGKATDKFGRKESTGFLSGDGEMKPRGLLTYPTTAAGDGTRPWGTFQYIPTGVGGDFAASGPADKILDLIYALKAAYRANARFLMSRSSVAAVRKLKDGQGNYLWQPSAQIGQPATLLGYGIAEGEDMPGVGVNALAMAFGDFAETYTIVDRAGVTVVRDNITQPGFVKFNFRKRVGGGAINFESLKFLKFAAS